MIPSVFRRGTTRLVVLCLVLLGAACGEPEGNPLQVEEETPPPATVTLVNFDAAGKPLNRFDTRGSQVDAHGGEVRWFGGRYYLYGETYGCGFEWHKLSPAPFCGYRVYSSPNLVEWTDHGLLFEVAAWDPWQSRCHWWSNGCFRPHVVFNRTTRKYVLWVNVYDRPVNYYVLESDTPTGPFVERGAPRLAFNTDAAQGQINNGDENLFVDDDGTGYVIYTEWARGNGDVVIEQLTPDYLNGTGKYVRLGVRRTEAPSMFKRNGRYYVTIGDPNCAYCETNTVYFTAPAPLGPWSGSRRISGNSCGGQPGHVSQLPTPGDGSWYLYMSDLWLNSDGRDGGDLNQAPAPQFWAPLSFDAAGEILPITCERSYGVPAMLAAPPSGDADMRRLQCDVGAAGGRPLMREFRFVAPRTGRARSVAVNTYQRGEPTSPLGVELRAVGAGGGTLLQSTTVEPDGPAWDKPVNIAWSARKEKLPVDAAVEAGKEYALRLRSATTRGCYGYAFRGGAEASAANSWVSTDGGTSWTQEAGQAVVVEVEVEP
ncbi:MAG TPA: family 43 glycosylhydrolase [Longimicrobiaceae bacterium]|nr:family 43 glycosylhydrolase [Longimicrobiaceae bacterium]